MPANVNIALKQGGDSFLFYNTTLANELEITAEQLYWMAHEAKRHITHSELVVSPTASTTILSTNIQSYAKWITVSMTSNLAAGSLFLTSDPRVGMELWITLVCPSACASGVVVVSCSGVSLVNNMGSDHSRFTMYNSGASRAFVHLVCRTAGEWAVQEFGPTTGSVTFT